MLIGVDASRAFVPHPTGAEIYSRELIRALLALGSAHRFRLYFRTAPPPGAFPGAEQRPIPFPRTWTHLRLSWEMARRPPDALFVPSHVLPIIHPPASVVTVHDLGYRYFPEAHPHLQRFYLEISTRWNARAAAHVLTDSAAAKADLVDHYRVDPQKITVAYPGRDESLAPVRDPARIAEAKARYGVTGDYYLYMGTVQPRKNLARVVAAFADLPRAIRADATLVLAGKKGWLYDGLFAQVDRLGLTEKVRFPGYVAAEDKAALLSGALAFVFPSLHEGFGFPVLEAQACGCPVITSAASSLPEVAGEAALMVDPQSVADISAAMARAVVDDDKRIDLITRGFVNLRRFSWERCAQTTLGIITHSMV